MPSGRGKLAVGLLVCALIVTGVGGIAWVVVRQSQATSNLSSTPAAEREISDAENKLAKVRSELKTRVEPAIARLRDERQTIRAQLKSLGVADSGDLKKDFKAQGFGKELAEIVGLIRAMEQKKDALDKSSFEFESFIRRLRRKALVENAGLTEQELIEVNTTLKTLDAQLADIREARPEISPAQLDSIIDEELGANSLQGRAERQLEIRKSRLALVKERAAAIRKVVDAAPRNVTEVQNLKARIERAIRQAKDEDRWPIKIAGVTLEEAAAMNAMSRCDDYIARQQQIPASMSGTLQSLESLAAAMSTECQDVDRLLEQIKADAGKSDEASMARAQEARAKVSELASRAAAFDAQNVLKGDAPAMEVFQLQPR